MQQTPGPRTPEESFGLAVSSMRAIRKMNQRQFASALTERGMTVDASAVSRIEKGSRSVRLVEAMAMAEVLEVDLDFLISGSKTPSQEFQAIRRRADAALRNLEGPIVGVAYALWVAEYHLEHHPELLSSLEDEDLERPHKPEEYLNWVAGRVERWEVAEDDFIVTDSEEAAERMIDLIARFARMHIGVRQHSLGDGER